LRKQKQVTIKNARTIFFTGATSGLGKEAAIELANTGNRILATYRSKELGLQLLNDFRAKYPNSTGSIELIHCDLSSFQSVVSACLQVESVCDEIDVLINNAGLWSFKRKETEDGIEETLQVNLLAPSLITELLLPLLRKSNDPRIINTASALHQGSFNFNDPELSESFSGFNAYRQSKLGLILASKLLAKNLAEEKIGVYINHPGLVHTGLVRDSNCLYQWFFATFGRTPQKGAENLIHLANAPQSTLQSGGFYKDLQLKRTSKESCNMNIASELRNLIMTYLADYLPQG